MRRLLNGSSGDQWGDDLRKVLRPTAESETFCCTFKDVKDLFADTDATIDFGFGERSFSLDLFNTGCGLKRYAKKRIKGVVVCKMTTFFGSTTPRLNFYIIKKSEYSDELRQKFIAKYLPEVYCLYKTCLDDKSVIRKEIILMIELLQGEFFIHKVTTDKKHLALNEQSGKNQIKQKRKYSTSTVKSFSRFEYNRHE